MRRLAVLRFGPAQVNGRGGLVHAIVRAGPMVARAGAWTALLIALWGCGGSDAPAPATVEPPLRLSATPESVAIPPSQSRNVGFRLRTEEGQPVPDRVIQFSILDDPGTPGDEAAGATLSFDRAVSDGNGQVT